MEDSKAVAQRTSIAATNVSLQARQRASAASQRAREGANRVGQMGAVQNAARLVRAMTPPRAQRGPSHATLPRGGHETVDNDAISTQPSPMEPPRLAVPTTTKAMPPPLASPRDLERGSQPAVALPPPAALVQMQKMASVPPPLQRPPPLQVQKPPPLSLMRP